MGDLQGHPFRGNQWTSGPQGVSMSRGDYLSEDTKTYKDRFGVPHATSWAADRATRSSNARDRATAKLVRELKERRAEGLDKVKTPSDPFEGFMDVSRGDYKVREEKETYTTPQMPREEMEARAGVKAGDRFEISPGRFAQVDQVFQASMTAPDAAGKWVRSFGKTIHVSYRSINQRPGHRSFGQPWGASRATSKLPLKKVS